MRATVKLKRPITAFELDIDENSIIPHWIPVTERLPEEDKDVLVTRHFLGIKDVPASTYVEVASRIGDDWVALSDEYKCAINKHTEPVAWMPLPEPYKEEQDGHGMG